MAALQKINFPPLPLIRNNKEVSCLSLSIVFHLALVASLFLSNSHKNVMTLNSQEQFISFEVTPRARAKGQKKKTSQVVRPQLVKSQDTQQPNLLKKKSIIHSTGGATSSQTQVVTKNFNKNILNNIPPRYPNIALRKGWQGKVLLGLIVGPDGKIQKVNVLNSSPFSVLNQAAVTAAKNWKFKPDHQGQAFKVKKEIIFAIQ